MIPTLVDALRALRPNDSFIVRGEIAYENIQLADENKKLPTEDELNAKLSELKVKEPFKLLRQERNRRLAECDWVVTKNAEYGYNIPKEWKRYRQALRDLPSISYRPELDEYGNLKMDSVAWPTPPE